MPIKNGGASAPPEYLNRSSPSTECASCLLLHIPRNSDKRLGGLKRISRYGPSPFPKVHHPCTRGRHALTDKRRCRIDPSSLLDSIGYVLVGRTRVIKKGWPEGHPQHLLGDVVARLVHEEGGTQRLVPLEVGAGLFQPDQTRDRDLSPGLERVPTVLQEHRLPIRDDQPLSVPDYNIVEVRGHPAPVSHLLSRYVTKVTLRRFELFPHDSLLG